MLRRLILEPALLVSLVDRSTPAQLVLDRTPWWVLCQFAQIQMLCAAQACAREPVASALPAVAKRPDVFNQVIR